MPSLRDFLLGLTVASAVVSPIGCKEKETVKTAKESPKTTTRLPPPPGK